MNDNPLWDAVAEVWFEGSIKRPHFRRIGKIVRDLNDLGATPNELRRRITNYRHLMPKCVCSPEAIVKWWDSLSGKGVAGISGRLSTAVHDVAPLLPHQQPIPFEEAEAVDSRRKQMSVEIQKVKQARIHFTGDDRRIAR